MEKVIIMLSTYNGKTYLEEQLNSINEQDIKDLKIDLYVRDDGSSDETLSILKKEFSKIQIHIVNDNKRLGACQSFLELIKIVPDANYYAFVDQDDIWDINKLSTAIHEINCSSLDEPVLWGSNCRIIDSKSQIIKDRLREELPIFNIPSQLICGSLQGCSMVFNKSLFKLVKESHFKYVPMHDILVTILAICNGKLIYNATPLFSYRVHHNNVVAKDGKSLTERIRQTLVSWFGKKNKYMISKFSHSILKECSDLDSYEKKYLMNLLGCKKNIIKRIKIVFDKKYTSNKKNAVRSFKIRVLLGII